MMRFTDSREASVLNRPPPPRSPNPKLLGGRRRAIDSGGPRRGVTPGRHAELRQDGGDVVVHGAGRYHQPTRDLGVRQPGRDQSQDLELAAGQPRVITPLALMTWRTACSGLSAARTRSRRTPTTTRHLDGGGTR